MGQAAEVVAEKTLSIALKFSAVCRGKSSTVKPRDNLDELGMRREKEESPLLMTGFLSHTKLFASGEHVFRNRVVPTDAFLIGLRAGGRVLAHFADEAACGDDAVIRRLICRADFDTIIRTDK